jgi:tetratricopeptide (TPR) repeat protein
VPWNRPPEWVPSARLFGRDELISELVDLAGRGATGRGRVVLLTGEAGVGKTSVLHAVTEQVRAVMQVSWGHCTAEAGAPPFWPWRTVIEVVTPAGADDAALAAIGAARFELLTSAREQLEQRAATRPLLHVIEDLQWADVASVLLLAELGATAAEIPLVVVATLRTGEPLAGALESALEDVRRAAIVRTVDSLDHVDVTDMVRAAGMTSSATLPARLHERTGGNPLFITELLRSIPTGNADADTDPDADALSSGTVPTRVAQVVTDRLRRLPDPVTHIARVASVIGVHGSTSMLARLAALDIEALPDLIGAGTNALIFEPAPPGQWRFRHALIRDAVYSTMTEGDRARLHAATVDELSVDPTVPPAVIAHHALLALPIFDADRAVALAARAGDAALAGHGYEEAASWFELALAATPSEATPRWRAELHVRCGEAHRQSGAIELARRSFLDAAGCTDDPELLARAALGFADPGADLGIAYRTGAPETAELLARAIAAHGDRDSVTTAMLEARLAAELYFSDEPHRARSLIDVARERARRLRDGRAIAAADAVHHDGYVVGQVPIADQLAGSSALRRAANASGDTSARLTAHRARVFDLLAAGDLAAMDAEILAFRRIAEPLRAPGYSWWVTMWSAMRALLEGDHALAEQRALAAYAIGERPFPALALDNLSFLLFFLRREQGRLAELESSTREYLASHADIPAIRVSLAFLLAETGRVDEAHAMFATATDAELSQFRDRNWPASWFQLARVAHLTGAESLARRLLSRELRPTEKCVIVSLATVCLGATDLGVAWLHHTLGEIERAEAHYESAAALNTSIGAHSWLAQTRADHARLSTEREAATHAPRFAPSRPPTSIPDGTFRPTGPVWELEYAGRTAQVRDSRGLHDLAVLLARPGEAVSALELLGAPDGSRPSTRGEEILDDRARREIRNRLRELDAEVDDAEAIGDGPRAALAREQRQQLAEAVARDLGLAGRSRRIGDPVERARKTVSTRIRRAIAGIEQAHPELGRHLRRSVDTGSWCAYRPAEPQHWTT